MQDHLIRIAVNGQIWKTNAVERVREARHRVADERGQTAAEYLGIVLLVAVIIAAIVGSGVHTTISREIGDLVETIVGGKDPKTENPGGAGS